MNALAYLVTRSFANGLRFRMRRLRQPKYLLGAILGLAYFYFYFGEVLGGAHTPWNPGVATASPIGPEIGSAILFVATIVMSWFLPASRAAITFSEAEIAFLFPSPLSRRAMVTFRLLKSQFTFLLLSAFVTLATGRFHAGAEAWFRVGGWWVILNTLSMHRMGASFALQRLRERGMADWKRRLAMALAVAGLCVAAELTRRGLPPLPDIAPGPGSPGAAVSEYVGQILGTGPLRVILAPFKIVVLPNFAQDAATFFRSLAPALGIMALHFLWVVRADVSFEEAAIDAAKRRAVFLAAHRQGDTRTRFAPGKARSPVFRLRPAGFAPVAFLWKSLLKFGGLRIIGRWMLLVAILAILALALGQVASPSRGLIILAAVIGFCCYVAILISLLLIGQHAAAQLRQGIAAMDLLKTYPIPGWQIALGELSGPVLLGTLMQWSALGIGLLLLNATDAGAMAASGPPLAVFVFGMAVVLPAFNLASAILPCAGALLFPGWFRPQDNTGPGIESTGLRLMFGIGQILAIIAALLPSAFLGATAWFAAGKWTSDAMWHALAAGGTATLVLAMEAGLGVAWLGSLYDKFDESSG